MYIEVHAGCPSGTLITRRIAIIANISPIMSPIFQMVPYVAQKGYCSIPSWLSNVARKEIMMDVIMRFFRIGVGIMIQT